MATSNNSATFGRVEYLLFLVVLSLASLIPVTTSGESQGLVALMFVAGLIAVQGRDRDCHGKLSYGFWGTLTGVGVLIAGAIASSRSVMVIGIVLIGAPNVLLLFSPGAKSRAAKREKLAIRAPGVG